LWMDKDYFQTTCLMLDNSKIMCFVFVRSWPWRRPGGIVFQQLEETHSRYFYQEDGQHHGLTILLPFYLHKCSSSSCQEPQTRLKLVLQACEIFLHFL